MIIKENEQWKEGGDCNKCRRLPYCNKPCKQSRMHFVEAWFDEYMKKQAEKSNEEKQ